MDYLINVIIKLFYVASWKNWLAYDTITHVLILLMFKQQLSH